MRSSGRLAFSTATAGVEPGKPAAISRAATRSSVRAAMYAATVPSPLASARQSSPGTSPSLPWPVTKCRLRAHHPSV